MLGHCRPPDRKRKLESEGWRLGIMAISPLVGYCPCVTYSSVPFPLLPSLSPRIYSIFCLANCPRSLLRSRFHNTNATTSIIVPSLLGPPWPGRPGHLHPFVHRHTELVDPTSTLYPWAQADLSHTLIVWLVAPSYSAIRSFSSATLAQCPELLGYLNPDALCCYIHGIPPSGAHLCHYCEQSLSLDSAFTPRRCRFSVMRVHPHLVAMGCRNVTYGCTHRWNGLL